MGDRMGLGTFVGLSFYFFVPCLKKKNMDRYDEEGHLKDPPLPTGKRLPV